MKVGIVTIFSIPNYGAMLQSHGLSSYLQTEGVDAEVINYRQPALEEYFRFKWSLPPAVNHWKRLRRCGNFIKERISVGSVPVENTSDLQQQVPQYDAFITGSDQVWFTGPVQYYDPMFFLDFPAPGKRKISYAASAGGNETFGEFEDKVRNALEALDHVGVRDAHTESLVRPLTDKAITRNVDPVLLHDFAELLSEKPPTSEPYILVFGDFRGELEQVVRDVRKATGIRRVISLQYPCPEADTRLPSPGPEEWLNWFRHAAFVVTSYFHGTVVAVKFNRPFVSVPTPGRRHKVAAFLESVSLRDRCSVDPNEVENVPSVSSATIDWQSANAKLDVLVTTSKSFLRDSLA